MNEAAGRPDHNDEPTRGVRDARAPAATAPGRCMLYAICSDLAASPFDAEPAVAGQPIDIASLGLPYALENFQTALDEWRGADRDQLRKEYSGLFEVGSNGPPVPIREDLHRNQPAGLREDIVRFYDFFAYSLNEKFAWAPDHLSVEIEFMHYLAYREAEGGEDVLSFQLAQHDFAARHLRNWVPELVQRIEKQQADALYGRVMGAISEFVCKDYDWQTSTIEA